MINYLINSCDIYQNAVLVKESRCDAFIKFAISLVHCFYIISASLALEVRGGESMLIILSRKNNSWASYKQGQRNWGCKSVTT